MHGLWKRSWPTTLQRNDLAEKENKPLSKEIGLFNGGSLGDFRPDIEKKRAEEKCKDCTFFVDSINYQFLEGYGSCCNSKIVLTESPDEIVYKNGKDLFLCVPASCGCGYASVLLDDLEIIVGENFGCVHFSAKS